MLTGGIGKAGYFLRVRRAKHEGEIVNRGVSSLGFKDQKNDAGWGWLEEFERYDIGTVGGGSSFKGINTAVDEEKHKQ